MTKASLQSWQLKPGKLHFTPVPWVSASHALGIKLLSSSLFSQIRVFSANDQFLHPVI